MKEGTARRSSERKEAALHYRLQMAAATQTVAGELEETRTMEWLWGIAATAGTLLSQEGGQIDRVVREVGGTLRWTASEGRECRGAGEDRSGRGTS